MMLWRRFTPLEKRVLAAVRDVLPPETRATFDAQVSAINRVQRLPPSWSEVSFYRMRWGRPDWSGVPMFPQAGELRIAEVRFRAGGRRYRAVVSCVGGYIFDLAVSPRPKDIAFASWDAGAEATLLADPQRVEAGEQSGEALPAAWTALLESGWSSDRWALHDGTTAYRVTLDDGEYLVLAERQGEEFLLHRLEPPASGFFLCRTDETTPRPVHGTLTGALGEQS